MQYLHPFEKLQAQAKFRAEPLDELNLTVPLDVKERKKNWDHGYIVLTDLSRKNVCPFKGKTVMSSLEVVGCLALKPVKSKSKVALTIRV